MSAIWVATWVMLLSKNHLPSGTVFNRVACATTWGQDDMIGFVVVLQPGYVVISMAHVANKGPKKPCPWTATCGRAGVCEICAGTMSTSVACAAFCIHDIIQTEGNEDAWGLDSNTGKLTLPLIGEHPRTHLGKLASPLNMVLGKVTLSLT